jgi:DNA-binding XRE family transcriptional regulator
MKERIEQIIESEHITSGKFALTIGTQPSVISHILNGRNKPSMEIIQKILETFPAINPDWLILGFGTMYRPSSVSGQTTLFDMQGSVSKRSETNVPPNSGKEAKTITKDEPAATSNSILPLLAPVKSIKKITVYYSDMTFEEFVPSNTIS